MTIRTLIVITVLSASWILAPRYVAAQDIRAAVDRGDIVVVRRALRAHGDQAANELDSTGTSLLHIAATRGFTDIAKLLIEAGANVNAHGNAGWTPLHYALAARHLDTVALLMKHGASMEELTLDGNMPIHIAARDAGAIGVAEAIIFGANVNARNRDGNTPLAVAAWYGRAEAARQLIAAGADIHARNLVGGAPLDEALRGGQSDIAAIIARHEVDVKGYEALMQRRIGYWSAVKASYAQWSDTHAHTKTVYKSDFNSAGQRIEPAWTTLPTPGAENAPLRISSTPRGNQRFLGEFGSQAVRLKLENLPSHHEMAVTFDLYIIRSWDGSDSNYGPDIWSLGLVGGPELLRTTFANTNSARSADKPLDHYKNLKTQAYPGEYPLAHNQLCTSAARINSLGYRSTLFGKYCDMDAVYKIKYTFPHTAADAVLNFQAQGLESLANESWGLANIEVSVDSTTVR